MDNKMKELKKIIEIDKAYNHVMTLLSWDLETEMAKDSIDNVSKTMQTLSELQYNNLVNDKFKKLLYSINENEINDLDKKVIKRLKKDVFEKMSKIPVDEYSKYNSLLSKSQNIWEKAKNENDFNLFKPYLKEIIETNKKFIRYKGYKDTPYNSLLDDFEEGMTVAKADIFFNKVKEELVPFALKVLEIKNKRIEEIKKKIKKKINKKFDKEKQKKLSYELAKIMGFDFNKGVLKESEHPFTTNMNNKDVRFTTHYHEDDLFSSIYSTAHEVGHAIYEQQISDEIDDTIVLAGGSTMGIHEAQSRFTENVIAKNRLFMPLLVKLLDKHLELKLEEDELYLLVNEVKKQYIRTEADELTYPIHVLIRYEIEKEIFSNLDKEIDIEELRKKWNNMYEKYLGIRPRTDTEGILQDTHWSVGLFGYFPSYAIGSAYASQMFESLCKEIDIEDTLKNEKFYLINNFLKERIHKYGKSLKANELILSCCNEEFNPQYYIDYLKEKFSRIYGVINV